MPETPARGDLIYLDFNLQAGHEQAGRRPGIVLSPKEFNEVTGFLSVCPITHTVVDDYMYQIALERKDEVADIPLESVIAEENLDVDEILSLVDTLELDED